MAGEWSEVGPIDKALDARDGIAVAMRGGVVRGGVVRGARRGARRAHLDELGDRGHHLVLALDAEEGEGFDEARRARRAPAGEPALAAVDSAVERLREPALRDRELELGRAVVATLEEQGLAQGARLVGGFGERARAADLRARRRLRLERACHAPLAHCVGRRGRAAARAHFRRV